MRHALSLLLLACFAAASSACSKPEGASPAGSAAAAASAAPGASTGWLEGAWKAGSKRTWTGTWDDGQGGISKLVLDLDRTASGVEGAITWTMTKVPPGSELSPFVGVEGHEWVRGTFDDKTGKLDVRGHKVDDERWLTPAAYALVVSKDGGLRGGELRADGTAAANVTAKPSSP